ncbi:MAG: amidohydrolase family protein [Actinomycetaceae bacterium]|nr:amidohydrolase family protein [Actinomycetaceae bacterium]MDY6082612.1 amidohydrolase family protein [Actinomycetaceae bacterium]
MQAGKLRVIDAHFHLWDPAALQLDWLSDMPALQRSFTIEDLEAEYERLGVNFVGGVYVEVDAADPVPEDRLIYENTSQKILKRVLRSEVSGYMRIPVHADGIRTPLHTPNSPRGRALTPQFQEGLRILASKDLSFDLVNRGEEIGDMAQAFSSVQDLRLIINHLGNVRTLDADSRAALTALAQLPKAYVKVSGDDPVNPDVVKFVRDTFGPHRVMFASNWPVVTVSSSLREHIELMVKIFGDDEDFFMNNAKEAYHIDDEAQ